jgi:uncharacterized protein YchJ
MRDQFVNAETINKHNQYVKNLNKKYDIVEDFFYLLLISIDSKNENLKNYMGYQLEKTKPDSLDEASSFLKNHHEWYLSIIRFIDKIERQNNLEQSVDIINEVYDSFFKIYDSNLKKFGKALNAFCLEMLKLIIEIYEIDIKEIDLASETFLEVLGESNAAKASNLILLNSEYEKKPKSFDIGEIGGYFAYSLDFIMEMRKLKKINNYNKNNTSKVAALPNRNDPCPCGSGLKYKKCCMLKEEIH